MGTSIFFGIWGLLAAIFWIIVSIIIIKKTIQNFNQRKGALMGSDNSGPFKIGRYTVLLLLLLIIALLFFSNISAGGS